VVKENYRRYSVGVGTRAIPQDRRGSEALWLFDHQDPRRPQLRAAEVEAFLRDKKVGPLEGFRSKAGWPFTAELKLVHDDELEQLEAGVRLRRRRQGRRRRRRGGGLLRPAQPGACPKCKGHVYEHGSNYVCEHAVARHVTCDFKTGKIILQQAGPP
jgi:DNA topoisomerase-3